ncbi:hypothetical protein [Proteiniborus sp.]|uniref:hypothetical protein n=1 Tax=Proteiniborus sp. TaxID=2079015 RepID=UPI0033264BC6
MDISFAKLKEEKNSVEKKSKYRMTVYNIQINIRSILIANNLFLVLTPIIHLTPFIL